MDLSQSEANNQLLSFDTLQSCDKGSREVQESNYMMSLFWGFVIWYHDSALKLPCVCQAGVKLDVIAATPESAIESASAKLSAKRTASGWFRIAKSV